jgi:hypothetical protein
MARRAWRVSLAKTSDYYRGLRNLMNSSNVRYTSKIVSAIYIYPTRSPLVFLLSLLHSGHSFFGSVGRLGFHAIQHYPHSASAAARGNIQEQLKGLDMLVFQAFKRLGGNVRVTAVIDGTAYEEKWRNKERDSISDQDQEKDAKESTHSECFSFETPPDTGKYYVGKGLHSPFLEDQLADEEECPSPGKFGRTYDFQHEAWSKAWYTSKKVTWLNREPKYGSKEFAMATIVVGTPPENAWGFVGSGKNFMLTIHVQTGNEPTTQAYYSTAAIIAEFD